MRAFTSHLKRCLALLLAVVLMVPAMSFAAFAAEECDDPEHVGCQVKTLAELIVENYGTLITDPNKPLTAAAKAVLTSGALTNDVEYHVDSVLGTGNVELDGANKIVTASVKPDGDYTWVPVSAGVYVNDVKVENITLAEDGGVYTGTYKYTGNVFYVQVEYELQAEVNKAAVAELLSLAAYLKGDLDVLDSLVTKPSIELLGVQHTALSVLNLLTDENVGSAMGLGEFGTIVGLIYDLTLSEEDGGKLNRTIDLPFEFNGSTTYDLDITMNREGANDAAVEMYAQQDSYGQLDLTKFFDNHSSVSNLEILANHSSELDEAVLYLYEAIEHIQYIHKSERLTDAGLPSSVKKLENHIAVLDSEDNGLAKTALTWVNGTVLPGLKNLEGYTIDDLPEEDLTDLSQLGAVITNLEAERQGVFFTVNQSLTPYTAMLTAAGLPTSVSNRDELVALRDGAEGIPALYAVLNGAVTAYDALDTAVAGLTEVMGIPAMIDELKTLKTALEGVNTLYSSLCTQLESIYDKYGSWSVASYFVDGTESSVYSSINSALYAVSSNDLEPYEDSEIVDSTVVLATATDKADMNMSDLTIVVRLNTLDGANDTVTSTLKKVVTLPSDTSYTGVKAEVDAFEAEALSSWQTSSLYEEEKYQSEPVTGMPDPEGVLGEDDRTVEIIYNPVDFTVTYVYGEAEDVPYGTTITLPKHDDATKAWDYMVGGKHYVQGQSFKVTEDVTVTREEGEAYNEIKVFPIAKERFGVYLNEDDPALTRIENIINSGALGVEDTIVHVRYPKDCVYIDQTEGDIDGSRFDVTAKPYVAVYQSETALWMPVSVTVYVVGGEPFEVKNPVLNDDKYLFSVNTQGEELDHVQVNYELDLDAADLLSKDSVIGTMNDVLQVYNDVVDQLDDLAYLEAGLENLRLLSPTILNGAKDSTDPTPYCTVCDEAYLRMSKEEQQAALAAGTVDLKVDPKDVLCPSCGEAGTIFNGDECSACGTDIADLLDQVQCPECEAVGTVLNSRMAIARMLHYNFTGNNLTLVNQMDQYLGKLGDPSGLKYYYSEGVYEAMDGEVQSLKGPMMVLGNDDSLLDQIEDVSAGASAKVTGAVETILGIELTGPDENLNNVGLNYLLSSLTPNFGATNSNATFEEVHEVTALPGGELVLTHSLPLSALNKVQVTVQITVEDKSGNRVVNVTTPVTVTKDGETATMDESQIEAVVSAVKDLTIPSKYTYYYLDDPKTQAVEAAYTEAGLRAELSKSLTGDLMIPYYFKEMHECTGTIATCTEPSYCIYCKAVLGPVDTSDSAHSWDEGEQTKAPDCVNTGLITYTCSACGGTKTKTVAALGHVMSDFESDNNVTCYSYGTKTAHCVREDVDCEYFVTEPDLDTKLLDHTMGAWQKVNDATHTRSCQNVGCTHTETEVHEWDEGSTLYAATCISLGKMVYTCSDGCGATKNEDIPMLSHKYEGALVGDENGHRQLCVNGCGLPGGAYEPHSFATDKSCDEKLPCQNECGYIKAAGVHAWGAWVEVEGEDKHQSSCSKCDDVKTEGHTYKGVVTKEPTCAEKGVMTYTCTVCGGGVYTKEIDNSDVKHKYTAVVTAPNCTDKGYTTYTCSVCEHSYDADYVDELGHNYASVVTAPTCTAEGYTTYTCSRCGDSYVGDVTEKVPHVYDDWYVYRKAVCGVDGERRRDCINCDGYETAVITAPTHDWDAGVVTKEPTCKVEGVMTYTCSLCGGTRTETIPVIDHDWGDGVILEGDEPTCTETGTKTFTCTMCGGTRTEEVPATGHDWDDGVILEGHEPTCTEKGTKTFTCQNDPAHTYTADIAATGHSYTTVVTPPNCTEQGYTTHTCTNVDPNTGVACNQSYVDTYVNALGHDWGAWAETKAPSCTAEGEERRDCNREGCDHYETRTVAKTAHTDGTDGDVDYYCDVCGARICPSHEYDAVVTPPTCTERGYTTHTCPVCGDSYVDSYKDELGHDYDSVVTYPTCTEKGYTTHTCSRVECGDSYVDTYVNALGHNYDAVVTPPTCTEQGYTTHTCTNVDLNTGIVCNHSYQDTFVNATGHDWDAGVVRPGDEATCTKEGTRTYTCQNNNEHTYTEPIEMLDHDYQVVVGSGDEEGHMVQCSCTASKKVDHVWVAVPDDERNVAATANSEGVQVYKCECGEEEVRVVPKLKPELPAEDHVYTVGWQQNGVAGASATVALPDNGGYDNYQMSYTITLPAYTSQENEFSVESLEIKVVVGNEAEPGNAQTVNLREKVMAEPEYAALLTADQWTEYFNEAIRYNTKVNKGLKITCELIDLGENQLAVFVNSLNGESDALSFSLVETSEDKYTIIANVADANSVQGAIMDVAMALVSGSYSNIGLKSHFATDASGYEYLTKYDNATQTSEISIQALINGILYKDGFGTDTIVKVFTETGAINPDSIPEIDGDVIIPAEGEAVIGGYLQTAYMALGNGDTIEYEVDFLLTMSQPAPALASARNALDQYSYLVSAETKDGKMQVSLKEKFYELYAAEMLATGVIDKNTAVQISNEAVCAYLHEYLVVLMGDGVSHETYENTLGKVGYNADLNSYKTIINRAIQMFGDAKLSDDKESMILDLSFSGKNLLDGLMEDAGVAIDSGLLEIIKEYKDGADPIVIGMTAVVEPDEVEYVAAVIDPYYGTTVDKIDFVCADEAAVRINRLGGAGMVILLADITGDLTFNHTTILDLNGYTVTGSIVANDTLYIVDSVMGADECGGVIGSVSGEGVSIVAGKYTTDGSQIADVSDCLAGGYIQNSDGTVEHELYTLVADEDGNVSVLLNSDATSAILSGNTDMAVDIAADLILNYMDCATMTFDGKTIYLVDIADVLALLEGNASYRDALIQEALGSVEGISGETENVGVKYAINAIIDDLLDFGAVADALESGDALAEYKITTEPLDIEPVYVAGEDYLSVKLGTDAELEGEEFTLSVLFGGDRSAEQADAFVELDKTTTADSQLNNLEVTYAGGTVNVTAGGTASVVMNLTDEKRFEIDGSQKNNAYLTVIALAVNEGGNASLLDAVETGTYTAQKAAFDDLTVKEVFDALKALNRGTTLEELLATAELEDAVDAEGVAVLSEAYHGLLVATGYVLDYLDITGDTRKMAKLDEEKDGVYEYSKADVTRTISNRINAVVTAESASLTIALFGDIEKYNVTVTGGTADKTEAEYREQVKITATVPEGYTFAGWKVVSDNVELTDATAAETTFTMPEGAVEVEATFEVITYTVTLGGTGKYRITVNGTPYTQNTVITVEHGDVITFEAAATTGYNFNSLLVKVGVEEVKNPAELDGEWKDNVEYTITVTGNMELAVKATKAQGGGGTIIVPIKPAQNCCSNPACGRNECHSLDYTDLSAILEENPDIWWHADGHCYLDYVICNGLMIGISETEFAPNMNMTRAMIVTALYRQEGKPEVTGKPSDYYTDAEDGTWYSDALVWATAEKIILGYGNNLVGPNDILTREQLATLFYRYTAHKGKDVEISGSVTDIFSDADQISDWAADGMEWACSRGLLIGPGNNVLVPKGDLRRCEFAALLCRWIWGEYDA